MTPDPIGLWGGINLFTYVQNNPVNAIDPEGLTSLFVRPWWGIFRPLRPPAHWPKPPGWTTRWQWRYPEGTSTKTSPRWFDPKGGEWRWHTPDKYHPEGKWDYNPWDAWNSPWRHVDPSITAPSITPPGDPCVSDFESMDWEECVALGLCT